MLPKSILFQTVKAADISDADLACHVFSVKDAVAYLATSDPSEDLNIEN